MAAPPPICAQRKGLTVLRRSVRHSKCSTRRTTPNPTAKAGSVDNSSPYSTLIHSAPLIPESPSCNAIAAPESPAMSAWLSLVGMPKYQAVTAQRIMASNAEHSATEAARESPAKLTMFWIVTATEALISVIHRTPKKLKTADSRTADFGSSARVATQVAMALGASVQPLTKMTPSVKISVTQSKGSPPI